MRQYELMELEPDAVAGAVAAARGPAFLGLGVTAPYKRTVAGLVDVVEPDAERIGAVNNVTKTPDGRLLGFNSDAPGFRAGVEVAMGHPLAGTEVVVAGAGGAAHAVAYACVTAGVRRLTIGSRSVEAATALAARFAGDGIDIGALALDEPTFGDGSRRRTWPSTRRRSGCSIRG